MSNTPKKQQVMNLPNRLTIARMAMIPLMVVLSFLHTPIGNALVLAVFCLASLTDFLDGYIARRDNIITVFGKFLDPVADKLLVLSAFVLLVEDGILPAWVAVLILSRELCVDGLRLVAMSRGRVMAAGWLGKVKTVSQMVLIIVLMLFRFPAFSNPVGALGTVWVAVITLWSGIDYFVKNGSVLLEGEA